ncbi:MAG: hypothetical protein HXY46_03515 [Syntrophaceae bacterium]|nr:hypothetical protein [Syntrophaceae bacterium]
MDLIVRSEDPDGDMVTYRYQWIRNGEEISGENKNLLKSGNFNKGDVIQVRVVPSDDKAEGRAFLSPPVKILNSPPVVQEVRIEPRIAYAQDRLRAVVKGHDVDEDPIHYTYQWEKNGVVLAEERTEALEKGRFKRGDSIVVTVTPEDGEGRGNPKKSEAITILNSPPVILSSPPTSVEGNEYLYQVKAEDPDGDPTSFSLRSGPKGMEIDKEKGLVRWTIQWRDRGTHPVEIEVSDKDGAKCFQRYVLNVEIR